MSTKHKRRISRSSSASQTLSTEALVTRAQEALEKADFRNAIADYKLLSKQDPRDEWRSKLALAYAGRARELTAKGMHKEALVMWENRAAVDPALPLDPDHCALLMRLDRLDPLLQQLTDRETPAALADQIRGLLAARLLSGDWGLAERIPAEDPLQRHLGPARDALDAYCAGNDAGVREALGQIPFRSPYRDWSLILKVLLSISEDASEAQGQLARISEQSPFAPFKQAASLALLSESDFMAHSPSLGRNHLRFVCALRGWSNERIALWEEMQRLGQPPKPEALIRLLQNQRKRLGENWARQRQLRVVLHHLPESERWLKSAGAARISHLESMLLAAWRTDLQADPWDIQERWGDFALALSTDTSHSQHPDTKLSVALALRRCDQRMDLLAIARTPRGEMSDLQEFVCDQVEQSLDWDPEDLATQLRLIRFFRHVDQLKESRRLLEAATKRWPEDRQILLETMETALTTNAFKKAAGLAKRILAIDPINTDVRERLVDAHLSHARKQILKSRFDLADKELVAASEWARGEQAREQIDLLQGFVTFLSTPSSSTETLAEVARRLGCGLNARLALILAGGMVGLPPIRILRPVGLEKPANPDRADLLAGLERLRRHLEAGHGFAHDLQPLLVKTLKGAPWKDLSRHEVEAVCETLKRARFDTLRQDLSKLALKRWRKAPIFLLHAFEAKYPNGCWDPMNKDMLDLEMAMRDARDAGDTRTSLRIQETLERSRPFQFGPSPFDDPFDLDDDEYDEDDFFDDADLPFGLGGSPEEMIESMRALGFEKFLDLLGLPPHIKRDMREAARAKGEDSFFDALLDDLETFGASGGRGLPLGPPKSKPRRKRRK